MEFERQKPVTDAYRAGYIRTFRCPQKTELELGEDGSITWVTTVHSNVCPILEERVNGD